MAKATLVGHKPKAGTHIIGIEEVMRALNAELATVQNKSRSGLVHAAAYIRNETEKRPPLTPVDLGNLRASWFVVSSLWGVKEGKSPKFKNRPGRAGKKANLSGKMAQDHSLAIAAAQATVAAKPLMVVMGYSAYYAYFIHEAMDYRFQRPGAGPKWFQAAITNNRNQLVYIVGKYAKIDGRTPKFKTP